MEVFSVTHGSRTRETVLSKVAEGMLVALDYGAFVVPFDVSGSLVYLLGIEHLRRIEVGPMEIGIGQGRLREYLRKERIDFFCLFHRTVRKTRIEDVWDAKGTRRVVFGEFQVGMKFFAQAQHASADCVEEAIEVEQQLLDVFKAQSSCNTRVCDRKEEVDFQVWAYSDVEGVFADILAAAVQSQERNHPLPRPYRRKFPGYHFVRGYGHPSSQDSHQICLGKIVSHKVGQVVS